MPAVCSEVLKSRPNTTQVLLWCRQRPAESHAWDQALDIFSGIEKRHQEIARALGADDVIQSRVDRLLEELKSLAMGIHLLRDCSNKAMDTLMSFGERLSSELFVKALRTALEKKTRKVIVKFLDVREVLKTDDQYGKARPLTEKIIEQCQALADCKSGSVVYVTQGFIGSTENGHTTTLGRGGSDYSAAILAEGISADVLEIWTDVPGIATTDPRIVPHAKSIVEISFTEASELATFGAKVLHPATLLPALRKNIPVFVGSSFDSGEKGTWVKMTVQDQPLVRALAIRKKQILVTLTTPEMLHSHGFLYRIFKVFNDHKVSIDAITTSEISVSMTLDDSTLLNKALLKELEEIADVQVEDNLCLVSIIGNNINHTPGLAKKVFESIANINVRMICSGASKHNFCFLVSEDQGEKAVQELHKAFC
jgi:aspartate kinase